VRRASRSPSLVRLPAGGYSEVLVAPGAPGRFTSVVGTLTAHGVNTSPPSSSAGRRRHDPRLPGQRRPRRRPADETICTASDRTARRDPGQLSARELIKKLRRDLLAKARAAATKFRLA